MGSRRRPGAPSPLQWMAIEVKESLGNREEREFDFTRRDFEEVRKLIYEHAGITLSDAKVDMVYSRLARRLRATRTASFQDYLARLRQGDTAEWEAFVNALTTNLTSFFRENHHFTLLKEFLKDRPDRPITIWCSASSTGEEPYSIAMTAVEVFGDFKTTPVQVLASDLDTNVLRKAQEGVYPIDRVSKMPEAMVRRYFLKGSGSREGQVRARPELQAMIRYFQLNLLAPAWPIRTPVDVIFCRNVMIYFDKPTQYKILKKMKPILKPDGLLFLGHSEALYHAADLFRLRGQTVYVHAESGQGRVRG